MTSSLKVSFFDICLTEDLLLDHNGVVKFVDFGAAKIFAKGGGKSMKATVGDLNRLTGTPMYMSPEGSIPQILSNYVVITGSAENKLGAMDIWSLGCCIIEMATGRHPWAHLDNEWAVSLQHFQDLFP